MEIDENGVKNGYTFLYNYDILKLSRIMKFEKELVILTLYENRAIDSLITQNIQKTILFMRL